MEGMRVDVEDLRYQSSTSLSPSHLVEPILMTLQRCRIIRSRMHINLKRKIEI